jgi:D-lactate dehydrogenase
MNNKILFFDTKPYDTESFNSVNKLLKSDLQFDFLEARLNERTASLAEGYEAICIFVHDEASGKVLEELAKRKVKLIALRCAGFNNVAVKKAEELGLQVVRVPEYSPYAVAEHAATLIMTLNRKTHTAYSRVKENNFSLNGLVGFDMNGKTVGVIGTGRIGQIFIRIMRGFGCKVLAFDLYPNQGLAKELGFEYTTLDELYKQSDIISLHIPLSKETKHLINAETIGKMKDSVILINTSRGELIETQTLIDGLKSRKIKAAGLDVYEEEEQYFFEDFSGEIVQDDQLARLLSFNNVIVTSHQAFFTEEALKNIATTTIQNMLDFFSGQTLKNKVKV